MGKLACGSRQRLGPWVGTVSHRSWKWRETVSVQREMGFDVYKLVNTIFFFLLKMFHSICVPYGRELFVPSHFKAVGL